jgi:hypothetical protein
MMRKTEWGQAREDIRQAFRRLGRFTWSGASDLEQAKRDLQTLQEFCVRAQIEIEFKVKHSANAE